MFIAHLFISGTVLGILICVVLFNPYAKSEVIFEFYSLTSGSLAEKFMARLNLKIVLFCSLRAVDMPNQNENMK